MRQSLLIAGAAMAALLILPTALTAAVSADGPCGGGADLTAKHAAAKAERLAKFDTDKDGKLDKTEREAAKTACAAKHAAAKAAHEAKRAAWIAAHPKAMAKIDTDSDGTISADERLAALAKHMKAKRPDVFAAVDANRDGTLTKDELKAYRQAHRADCK